MMLAVRIDPDARIVRVELPDGDGRDTLAAMQAHVGGSIEGIPGTPWRNVVGYVSDDSLFEAPPNAFASAGLRYPLHGSVLLTGIDGDKTVSLTDEQVLRILEGFPW